MLIPIKQWAQQNFSFPVSQATLNTYAKTKQISPPPQKIARRWCCEENAKFVGMELKDDNSITDPLVREILYGSKASKS